jgi:hypothetical protein
MASFLLLFEVSLITARHKNWPADRAIRVLGRTKHCRYFQHFPAAGGWLAGTGGKDINTEIQKYRKDRNTDIQKYGNDRNTDIQK